MSRKIVFLVLSLLVLGLVLPASAAQAQCAVQSSWPTYVVQPGDTLARIAQRYGTTVAALQTANCIAGTRIYAYQTLRVPPAGGQPGPINTVVNIAASFQPFENGFMVWSSDSSAISVYINNRAQLRSFAARTYSPWAPPPFNVVAPAGRFVPTAGFGKVWYTGSGISTSLGWALSGEQGFVMSVTYNNLGRVVNFSLPTGQYLVNNFNGTWSYSGVGVPPPVVTFPPPIVTVPPPITPTPYLLPTSQIGFTYQPFDGGFMVWRADSSDIYAYLYATSELFVFPARTYGGLGINTALIPPVGRLRPDNGFGRVWSNYGNIRAALGWALTGENGYLSTVQTFSTGQTYSFTIPDGRTIARVNDRLWTLF